MLIIEEFRKIIKNELGNLWEVVQREVNEYFNIIDFANITYRKNYNKLNKPEKDFLNDPLNIPEIYKLLYFIKENNFDYFDRNSITKNYNHYEHGYFIRDDLLIQLEPILKRVESFRIDNFNKISKNQKKFEIKDKFITYDFKDYGLMYYNSYINIINGIAFHEDFYIILPNLLRCLFENLLYDIFQTALDKKHTEFFFLKSQSRARDFSQLIVLLNILKNRDFKPYHKDSLNQSIIDVLKEIQIFGNWTVHQILRQVDKDFADQWEQKINRVLLALLVFYKKIQDKALEITDQDTLDKINKTLNLEKSIKQEKDKLKSKITKYKVIIQEEDIPIDEKNVLNSLLPDLPDGAALRLKYFIENNNWESLTEDLKKIIKNLFSEQDFYRFAIFSLARISCAIYLGYLLTNRVKIRYAQYQRDSQTWEWKNDINLADLPKLKTSGFLKKVEDNIDEIIVKISLSAKILDGQIKELGFNLKYKMEIAVDNPSEDWLKSELQVVELGGLFRDLLANLRINAPNLEKINLFYAGPTAGAVAIGRQINPRMTPVVQLYEFDRSKTPNYEKSILIGG